ncbi:MAG: MBL fold metallo-hydrolase [Firmicutes bacterium HGW-Firmicutes-2]|jgi:7,8-dihydropterin-6-yl-methyl-4-(beta-D-ribofuranosyl)aminobenzene 5'-phosphate synthase|nr:MAG: MBL fold metallo-hydrolase [Firmicutes bacterium HGW-Firmicutes-2]PKP47803.1 MAG: MBL fold metallo-hydrolase [Bacteroidetes bacterium HGW-Bacteroidetes-1]
MKLVVLVDNNTYIDQYYYGEPGVSYYIEDEDTKLLWDVGYSDLFLRNANAMGIDLENLDAIVISHGHDDHTRGLKYYFDKSHKKDITVIAHPDAFKDKVEAHLKISSPILEVELKEKCHLVLSKEPIKVSTNITFLGEIPQLNNFENRKAIGQQISDGTSSDDYLMDDSALVYKSEKGIYIITGCSHSGICNIIEYAKQVSKDNRVLGIIGGFHLFEVTEHVHKTIDFLKQNHLKEIYASHCTSFAVRAEIYKVLPIKEVGVGLEVNW